MSNTAAAAWKWRNTHLAPSWDNLTPAQQQAHIDQLTPADLAAHAAAQQRAAAVIRSLRVRP